MFNGVEISTLAGANFDSQLIYALIITPPLVVMSVVLVCTLGLLGSAFPAVRVARTSVACALREI